ncbi:helix-turn-helix transcriptional regulator [Pseudohaliea sp.]|uniref:helix-turn-helix domain-containing protein n=1 Tax=Pseudohaliea sp. TaxID=2740289 RepID=UPI0032EED468
MANADDKTPQESLLDALKRLTGQVAGGTMDLAVATGTLGAMFGETWLRNALALSLSPERHEAMAEAGHLLRDLRQTAGLSLRELSEDLGLADPELLADVERGEKILPIEHVLRAASLLARHDPVPFLIRFLRTYNPQLERALEDWGVMALPKQFERERRFINLYRQHDFLRELSDDEFARFIDYMDSSTHLVADVMAREKAAWKPVRKKPAPRRKKRPATTRRGTGKRSGD